VHTPHLPVPRQSNGRTNTNPPISEQPLPHFQNSPSLPFRTAPPSPLEQPLPPLQNSPSLPFRTAPPCQSPYKKIVYLLAAGMMDQYTVGPI